jgi:peptidyl-prolyl cis-trans isomerase B (cyclophilin B)
MRIMTTMKVLLPLCAVALALGLTSAAAEESKAAAKPDAKPHDAKPQTSSKDKTVNTNEVAVIKTSEGEMVLEFWPDVAPGHVENFKKLARQGFYDGTCFHRVIKGFMIQGGDPLTKDEANKSRWGTGGPGYSIKAEFNDRPHVRGVLSMARANDPNSAGSQFFICHGDPRFLDGKYTAFGKLIKGDDVLEKIATTPTDAQDRPLKRIQVESIRIVAADALK